jgi:hypothetical protein
LWNSAWFSLVSAAFVKTAIISPVFMAKKLTQQCSRVFMNQADYRVKHLNSAQGKPNVKNNENSRFGGRSSNKNYLKLHVICLEECNSHAHRNNRYRMLTWSQIMSPPFTWWPLHSCHFEFSQEWVVWSAFVDINKQGFCKSRNNKKVLTLKYCPYLATILSGKLLGRFPLRKISIH